MNSNLRKDVNFGRNNMYFDKYLKDQFKLNLDPEVPITGNNENE